MSSLVSTFVLLILFVGIQCAEPPRKGTCNCGQKWWNSLPGCFQILLDPSKIAEGSGKADSTTCVLLFQDVPECSNTHADIAFVLDSSSSISQSDFAKELSFFEDIINAFEVSPTSTRIAVVSYGYGVYTSFGFDAYRDKRSLKSAVDNIVHMAGTKTETGEALKHVQDTLLPKARPGMKKFAIVLTDGNSQDGDKTARSASSLRDAGMEVFAVGVGLKISDDELRNIAGNYGNVFRCDNYQELNTIKRRLVPEVCDRK